MDPLHVDVSPLAVGLAAGRLVAFEPGLDAARGDLLAAVDRARAVTGDPAPDDVAAAGIDLPDRLLADYATCRPQSGLYAILQAAHRVRDMVDRVIVIGAGGCHHGPRLLFESCCHPWHNELSRGDRGGRPRVSFVGGPFANDLVQGLLDLVAPPGRPASDDLLDRWAILAADQAPDMPTASTMVATRLFLAALDGSAGEDDDRRAECLIPIAPPASRLAALGRAVGCRHAFAIDPALPEACSLFTAAGLLPAAIAGIDVVRLLEGAAAVTRRFREASVAVNPVLQLAGVLRLAAGRGLHVQMTAEPGDRLDAVCQWHGACLHPPHLDRAHSDARAADAAGRLDMRLVVSAPRRDPLAVPAVGGCGQAADGLDAFVGRQCSAVVRAAGADAVAGGASRPHVTILLPRVDEHAIGQLLQLQILAAAVARRDAAAGGRMATG